MCKAGTNNYLCTKKCENRLRSLQEILKQASYFSFACNYLCTKSAKIDCAHCKKY